MEQSGPGTKDKKLHFWSKTSKPSSQVTAQRVSFTRAEGQNTCLPEGLEKKNKEFKFQSVVSFPGALLSLAVTKERLDQVPVFSLPLGVHTGESKTLDH